MTKFEEISKKGKSLDEKTSCGVEVNPLYLEWQELHGKIQASLEKSKNRISIVNFKIRVDDPLK